MISVVVQGRNDVHGYNLHKRAAISLNAIAHVLSQDDEIIFVDWNTPDALPTFPEAIADTLTEACRARLRVLRVRPEAHRRASSITHLPLIDPVARNVAIRRASPKARWILSTTTDMVFAPPAGRSLSDLVEGLEPALYHMPRFDVPEALWECLDRREPAGAIAACQEWGRTLSLEEVVETSSVVRFDGPGDFQLLPREAAHALCGFDERMVFTYHMDSNLAVRAVALLGPVRTLAPDLKAYHCSHYRSGSVHHDAGRAENSWPRFVEAPQAKVPPGQHDAWGLADEAVEELRLASPGRARLADALATAAKGARPPPAVRLGPETFNTLDYPTEHVLPFVVDLMATLPPDATVGVVSVSEPLLRGIEEAAVKLGLAKALLAPKTPGFAAPRRGKRAALSEILAGAQMLVFDFSAGPDDRAAMASLSAVAEAFDMAVARERERPDDGAPQRFVVVNGIHTVFERRVLNHLAFTYTPFTTRVRHGVVRRDAHGGVDLRSLAAWIGARTGRRTVGNQEVADALEAVSAALQSKAPPAPSGPVLALLEHPLLPAALGANPALAANLAEFARSRRPSARLEAELTVGVWPGGREGPGALSKFASILDWEHPPWCDVLRDCGEAAQSLNFLRRHRSTWELGQLVYAARALAPNAARALVVAPDRLTLAAHLTASAGQVDLIAAGGSRAAGPDAIWPHPDALWPPERVRVLPGTWDELTSGGYDLILAPGSALTAEGAVGFLDMLRRAEALLAPGGVLVAAVDVTIGQCGAGDRIPAALLADRALERLAGRALGLNLAGESDWRLDAASLDRMARADTPEEREPHFIIDIGGVLSTTAVISLRKESSTGPTAWAEALAEWRQLLGSQPE